MAAIHSVSTKPELKLRFALWHLGFRYRINQKCLPGSPDIVLPKYRTVIFVHGCFWHGHRGCEYYTIPQTNTDFWKAKVAGNQERDQEVWRQLEAKNWYVIIVWECQLKKKEFKDTLDRVEAEIIKNGDAYRRCQDSRKEARKAYLMERGARKKREEGLMAEIKR